MIHNRVSVRTCLHFGSVIKASAASIEIEKFHTKTPVILFCCFYGIVGWEFCDSHRVHGAFGFEQGSLLSSNAARKITVSKWDFVNFYLSLFRSPRHVLQKASPSTELTAQLYEVHSNIRTNWSVITKAVTAFKQHTNMILFYRVLKPKLRP